MEDAKTTFMSTLQAIQLAVTVGLAVLGFWLNQEAERTKEAVQRIELDIKLRQDQRASQEGGERLRIQMFGHVSTAIEKKDARQQQAAKALVISLLALDDPLRIGLIEALTAEAEPSIKPALEKVVQQERDYRQQEALTGSAIASAKASASPTAGKTDALLSRYFIDVFYCTGDGMAGLRAKAEATASALAGKTLKIRTRVLPDSLNASPGYRVGGLQIRYNNDERVAAESLRSMLIEQGHGDFTLHLVATPTNGYMSAFICS